jgi:hypothetical protein
MVSNTSGESNSKVWRESPVSAAFGKPEADGRVMDGRETSKWVEHFNAPTIARNRVRREGPRP